MSRPYFKFYGRDFRDGVRPLNLEEVGAYTLLLTLIYDAGGAIPDDARAIQRHLGCDPRVWKRVRQRLLDHGKLSLTRAGSLTNARAEKEIAETVRVSEIRAENGRAGGVQSGAVRSKSATSPRQVREKFARSPANICNFSSEKPNENNTRAEAIASNQNQNHILEVSYSPSTAATPVREAPPPVEKSRSKKPDPQPSDDLLRRCLDAAGPGLADPAKVWTLTVTAPRIGLWLKSGADLELDVLPTIARLTARHRDDPIANWSWFDRQIAKATALRTQAGATPLAAHDPIPAHTAGKDHAGMASSALAYGGGRGSGSLTAAVLRARLRREGLGAPG